VKKTPETRRFWNEYAKAAGIKAAGIKVRQIPELRFGDTDELTDELAALVVEGKKRAHAGLPRDFVERGRRLPRRGDFAVLVDSGGAPRCVIRYVEVAVRPMREVDEHFAWEDGGGDRTLAWWMSAHTRYFRRRGAEEGFSVDGDTEVVLERFEVVWPARLADKSQRSEGERST
jgi:uncharacterized protein YhfF